MTDLKIKGVKNLGSFLAKPRARAKPTVESFHHGTELRDKNALRLLIENKFRTALENRKQKPVEYQVSEH